MTSRTDEDSDVAADLAERAAQETSLGTRAARGVLWNIMQQWTSRLTGFVTVAILARLLVPADFGVVAVALSVLPLLQLLADVGFSSYLVQADSPQKSAYDTAFWYSAVVGLVLAGGLFFSAPAMGLLLGNDVTVVLRGLAPSVCLIVLGSVPVAVLRRRFQFRELAIQGFVATMIAQATAVAMALAGAGVWALVAQTLVVQSVSTVLVWRAAAWRPRLAFVWSELRQMLHYGIQIVGIEVVTMGRAWTLNAIVVSAVGLDGLGYLSIAQRLISIIESLTISAVVPVSVVVFAKLRSRVEELAAAYVRAQALSYAVVTPAMVLLAVGAPVLVPTLFGSHWEPSVVPAEVLGIAGVFGLVGFDQGLFLGMGRPALWLWYVVASEAVTVVVAYATVRNGLEAFSYGFLVVCISALLARAVMVARQLRTSVRRVIEPGARVWAIAAVAFVAGHLVMRLGQPLPPIPQLAGTYLAVLAVYVPLLRWTNREVWQQVCALVASFAARFFGPKAVAL